MSGTAGTVLPIQSASNHCSFICPKQYTPAIFLKAEKCKIKLSGIEYLDTLEKSDTDFELAKRTLSKFPATESRAKWAFFIGIGLAILELIKLAIQLLFPSGKT